MASPRAPRGGFLLQGVLVALSNPRRCSFAPCSPFNRPARDGLQILIMGLTAMTFAAVSDSAVLLLQAVRAVRFRQSVRLSRA